MKQQGTYYVFHKANQPLEKVEMPLPDLRENEILVNIRYITLCGSDLHTYCGFRREPCPTILGHEIVGIIEQISPSHSGVDAIGTPLHIGDLVTWTVFASDPNTANYQVETPQKNSGLYKYGHRQITANDSFHGGLASHIILRPHTCLRVLPQDIPLGIAATINCAIATSAGAVRLTESVAGKNVHIAGIGLLGLVAIAMCKEMGANSIIASDINEDRLKLAKAFGATHTLNLKQQGTDTVLKKLSIDCFLDMSGSPDAMELGIDTLQLQGKAVFVGAVFNQRKTSIDAEQVIRKMLTIKGLHNYNYTDFSNAVDFITRNWKKYPFQSLIERDFPLSSINEAIQFALANKPIRAGIYTSHPSAKTEE